MGKEELLRQYYENYKTSYINEETVPGFGNAYSRVVLIGEAPGRDEIRQSRPFAGRAGRYLDEFLEHAGISRNEIYITNSIKYRLSKTDPRTGRISNRPAEWSEVEENRPWLVNELDILRPEFVVTLGNVPLRAVTGERRISIGDVHGRAAEFAINEVRYTLYPLYHPASVIYNRSLKDTYINDIKGLKSLLPGE